MKGKRQFKAALYSWRKPCDCSTSLVRVWLSLTTQCVLMWQPGGGAGSTGGFWGVLKMISWYRLSVPGWVSSAGGVSDLLCRGRRGLVSYTGQSSLGSSDHEMPELRLIRELSKTNRITALDLKTGDFAMGDCGDGQEENHLEGQSS